ncbi:MAG: tetratricopeptide repeat protein [Gemmatimonadota bacterium]
MRTKIIRGLTLLAFLLAVGWVLFDPAWESGITAVVLLAGFISASLAKPEGLPSSEAAASHSLQGPVNPKPDKGPRAIAVLPFSNLSPDPEDDYFSDGITDELINTLGQARGLRVTARTSAFVFKGSEVDAREIGKKLGVDTLLEGTVRRSGDHLRISTQLIDVTSGFQLWSAKFDRELGDVFRIQEEIADSVVGKLSSGEGSGEIEHTRSTESLPAYDAYLRALSLWSLGTPEGWTASIKRFRSATELDPDFALSHAGLALGNFWVSLMEVAPASEVLPELRQSANQAMRIDPNLFESILANAVARAYSDWDWQGAEEEFKRAITANPSAWMAHHQYATFLSNLGRPAEGVRHIELARQLDPLNVIPIQTLGWCHFVNGDFDGAEDLSRQALELQPQYSAATIVLGFSLLGQDRIEEAVSTFEVPIDQGQMNPFFLSALVFVLGEAGRKEEAIARRAQLYDLSSCSYVSPVFHALGDVGVGDLESAIRSLRTAATQRSSLLITLPGVRWWDKLRKENGFSEVMGVVGFSRDNPAVKPRSAS